MNDQQKDSDPAIFDACSKAIKYICQASTEGEDVLCSLGKAANCISEAIQAAQDQPLDDLPRWECCEKVETLPDGSSWYRLDDGDVIEPGDRFSYAGNLSLAVTKHRDLESLGVEPLVASRDRRAWRQLMPPRDKCNPLCHTLEAGSLRENLEATVARLTKEVTDLEGTVVTLHEEVKGLTMERDTLEFRMRMIDSASEAVDKRESETRERLNECLSCIDKVLQLALEASGE